MNKTRYFGSDVQFAAWMRRQNLELPSYSPTCGFVATDVDLLLHRYMTEVDGVGTRQIQGMMMLEVKSRGGDVHVSQRDTLLKWHLLSIGTKWVNDQEVRSFGVSFVFLSGSDPDDSREIIWGRFANGLIRRQQISRPVLIRLMKFELHPDNLQPRAFRRHHKTQLLYQVVKTPLGLEVERPIIKRS